MTKELPVNDESIAKNALVYSKAYKLAIRIVNAYKYLSEDKKEFILSEQLLKSGIQIGANIAEGNKAILEGEFLVKMNTAYRQCLQTKYWLSLLKDIGYIFEKPFNSIYEDVDEIEEILFSIVNQKKS